MITMIKVSFISLMLFLVLTSCNRITINPRYQVGGATPSSLPNIESPTPSKNPSFFSDTPTHSLATTTQVIPNTQTAETYTPTFNNTITYTQTPGLLVSILECNTSLDIFHQMGEVTNAYPLIQNISGKDLTNVCATLSASDEARVHPDKTSCVPSLPDGYEVTLKLTADTGFEQDSSIRVDINDDQGYSTFFTEPSCREIGVPGWSPTTIGVIERMH
jgi:hypothetical protein